MGHGLAIAGTPQAPWKVIIADDMDEIRRMLRKILARDLRFEVVAEARDGFEAVDLANTFRPDLVVLDLMMPRKSGADALEEIKATSASTRVVIFSSVDSRDVELPNADAHISKAASAAELLSSIEAVLAT